MRTYNLVVHVSIRFLLVNEICVLVKGKKGILIKIPMHEIDILIKVLFQSTFNGKGLKCEMQFENEL